MGRLSGQVAVVSGGSRGIGKAIVQRLASEGARVVFTYKSAQAEADALCAELKGREQLVECLPLQVERLDDCEQLAKTVQERHGGLHILVNNAGLIRDGAFATMPEASYREVIEVELIGTMNLAHAVLPMLMRAGGASIVNIGSIAGDAGNPGQANHSAAKAGVVGFTRTLAQELGGLGVRVNCVSPGAIQTSMWDLVAPKKVEKMTARIPLRRFGTVEEIAAAVAFLASSDASYITGQVLAVNGGLGSAS